MLLGAFCVVLHWWVCLCIVLVWVWGGLAAAWTDWLRVPATGTFTFYLESVDGSRLYIDGALRVDNGGGAVDLPAQ